MKWFRSNYVTLSNESKNKQTANEARQSWEQQRKQRALREHSYSSNRYVEVKSIKGFLRKWIMILGREEEEDL